MRITKTQIGAALGVVILLCAFMAVSYGLTSFILWEWSMAAWGFVGRCTFLGIYFALGLLWFIFSRVEVVDGP